ncbi:hypothetical protein [Caudoviricetes sp.]|nr:hypothetical protein [Caudoviricetes sp.]
MNITSPVSGAVMDFDPTAVRSQSDATHQLGALVQLNDDRAFRYVKAGASNISKGKLQQAPAPKANHANLPVTATAAGATTVNVTPGATAVVAGEYNEGYAVINVTPGAGQVYKISNNPAANASTAFNLALLDQVLVALTTSSKLTLVHNQYNAVVEVAAATRRASGVPLVDVTAGYFAWAQTNGVAGVLAGTAVTVGSRLISDGTTAGAVTDNTDVTAPQAEVEVAKASIMAGVTGEYRPVVLCID